MSAQRNVVGTYRRKGTFRAQHAEKTGRAGQRTVLPPRCRDCRLPGTLSATIDGVTVHFCAQHIPLFRDGERDEDV